MKKKKSKYSIKEQQEIIEDVFKQFEEGKNSIPDACKAYGIEAHDYYNWRRKFVAAFDKATATQTKELNAKYSAPVIPDLKPVKTFTRQTIQQKAPNCELKLANGAVLSFPESRLNEVISGLNRS